MAKWVPIFHEGNKSEDDDEITIEYSVSTKKNERWANNSWGWAGNEKIIVFDTTIESKIVRKKARTFVKQLAQLMTEADLNPVEEINC